MSNSDNEWLLINCRAKSNQSLLSVFHNIMSVALKIRRYPLQFQVASEVCRKIIICVVQSVYSIGVPCSRSP